MLEGIMKIMWFQLYVEIALAVSCQQNIFLF